MERDASQSTEDAQTPPEQARFTRGSVPRHLARMSGYMAMGFIAMTSAQLVEAVYLGILGTAELAAVAFTFPVVMTLNAAARGLGVGASSVIARVMGSGERERSARLVSHALVLVASFSLLCAVIGLAGGESLFRSLGASGEPLLLALAYMEIWFAGFLFFGISLVGSNLLRAIGNAAMPGILLTGSSLVQMALGPVLIFGWFGVPALGIEGAAWAFVLARVVGTVLLIAWLVLREDMLRRELAGLLRSWRDILHVGIPASATNMIQPLSTAILTRLLAGHGAGIVAGFGVASRVDAVMAMIIIAVSSSVGPFVGQNWGARRFERVHQALRLGAGFSLAWGLLTGMIMLFAGEWLVALINDDPDVVDAASWYLWIIPVTVGFMGMTQVAGSCFNALGRPVPPLVLSVLRLVVLLIPLALIGGWLFDHIGIFLALGIANVVVGIMAWVWNQRMVVHEAALLAS